MSDWKVLDPNNLPTDRVFIVGRGGQFPFSYPATVSGDKIKTLDCPRDPSYLTPSHEYGVMMWMPLPTPPENMK